MQSDSGMGFGDLAPPKDITFNLNATYKVHHYLLSLNRVTIYLTGDLQHMERVKLRWKSTSN